MVVCKEGREPCRITLGNITLQEVKRYQYLESWITENARCEEEIRARIGMARTALSQNKKN